ncbi:hypothetical protein Pfo_024123 [Paulownia fortunei]|nr:hypothetical protein Pfo_024123 [Paulownia fortunei]
MDPLNSINALITKTSLLEVSDDQNPSVVEDPNHKSSKIIITKVLPERPLNLRAIKSTLLRAWENPQLIVVNTSEQNTLAFVFKKEDDCKRVLSQSPWCFRVMVASYRDSCYVYQRGKCKIKIKIGNAIGKFIRTDLASESQKWKHALCIQVDILVHQPLQDIYKLEGPNNSMIIVEIRYERLGDFFNLCPWLKAENTIIPNLNVQKTKNLLPDAQKNYESKHSPLSTADHLPTYTQLSEPKNSKTQSHMSKKIDTLGICDSGFVGHPYTWSNKFFGLANIQLRLDMFLANSNLRLLFPRACVSHLPSIASDHSPLLLLTHTDLDVGLKPFHFEEMWLRDESCEEIVSSSWKVSISGSFLFRLHSFIKRLKENLKNEIRILVQSPKNCAIEETLQVEWDEKYKRMEILWRQKAKQRWLQDGDANTNFFHLTTIFHQVHFPRDLEFLFPRIITDEDNRVFCEIPSPDGFPPAFFKSFWHIMGKDLVLAVQHFSLSGFLLKAMNHTFVSLIPKNNKANSVEHFRPISLYNVTYKTISKILANRLKPLLDRIISPNQMAFVQEKKRIKGFMVVKIDLFKGYDRVDTKILGFNDVFTNWIFQCVSTTSFSFLINNSIFGSFCPTRGIRQGDPLSLYLFIIYSELLSRLIIREENSGNLKGIKICRKSPTISHLFNANDLIIFCRANPNDAQVISDCLDKYACWSSQLICTNLLFISVAIAHNLSQVGRTILIKSIAQAIPIYHMSTFLFSKSLCDKIDSLMHKFWWDTSLNNRFIALKYWDDIYVQKYREIIRKGACYKISTSSKVKVWEDPWIPTIENFIPSKDLFITPIIFFLDALFAERTWFCSHWNLRISSFRHLTLEDSFLPTEEFKEEFINFWVIVFYIIWKVRNEAVHGGTRMQEIDVARLALKMSEEHWAIQKEKRHSFPQANEWKTLLPGWLKVNTDIAFHDGGVKMHAHDVSAGEMLAIQDAFEVIDKAKVDKVIFEIRKIPRACNDAVHFLKKWAETTFWFDFVQNHNFPQEALCDGGVPLFPCHPNFSFIQ